MLDVFRGKEQTFFLAWTKMGDRSPEPCHWMCTKPNWKAPAMSGGANTRKEQKSEAEGRQGLSTLGRRGPLRVAMRRPGLPRGRREGAAS